MPGLRPLMLRGKVCTSKNERNQEFFQMFPTSRSKPQSLGNVIEMSMPLGKNVRVTNRNFFTTASLVSSILFSETGCVFRGCLRSPSTVKHRSGPRAEMLACFVLVLRRCSQSQYSSPRKHPSSVPLSGLAIVAREWPRSRTNQRTHSTVDGHHQARTSFSTLSSSVTETSLPPRNDSSKGGARNDRDNGSSRVTMKIDKEARGG